MPRPKPRRMYIEQKNDGSEDLQDRGPAVIGTVQFSKTGRTIYFEGKTFQRNRRGGCAGNYRCLEDGNEYWITGVKSRGSNRYPWANAPVEVRD